MALLLSSFFWLLSFFIFFSICNFKASFICSKLSLLLLLFSLLLFSLLLFSSFCSSSLFSLLICSSSFASFCCFCKSSSSLALFVSSILCNKCPKFSIFSSNKEISLFSFVSISLIFDISCENKSKLFISFIGNWISILSKRSIGNMIKRLRTSLFFCSIAKNSFLVNCSNSTRRLSML